ncbi:MAG: GAF domain-containing protein, partial [Anaerolineae bacterium]
KGAIPLQLMDLLPVEGLELHWRSIPLHRRISYLRWLMPVIVLALAAIHQGVLRILLARLPAAWHSHVQLAVYGATGIVVAWIGLTWIARAVARQEQAEADLRSAYADLERTHRQLQTIHQIGRRVTNAADVQELLDIAGRVPVELLGARATSVITFDEEKGRADLEMTWGLSDPAVRALRRRVQASFPVDRCTTCRPLTAQISQDCPLLMSLETAGCAEGIDRVVCLPLGRGQERVGVIAAYMDQASPLLADQVDLVNILATEITAAMEGVRLRANQMTTLYAVDRVTQEHHDLDALLERVLATTVAGWGAQVGAILLTEGTDGTWSIRAQQGLGDDLGSTKVGLALQLAEETQCANRPLIVREYPGEDDLASVAAVSLQAEGETLGALFLGAAQPGIFTVAQEDLLTAIAHQIALAVRNVQLYSRLRQMAVLEERYRLSREMHDGLAQTLGYLGMQAERLERLQVEGRQELMKRELTDLREAIAEAYLDVREAIDGLRRAVDQPGGLMEALQAQLEDFARRTGLTVDDSRIDDPGELPPELALHLLRIAQEALTNVRRHAQASHVTVRLLREDDHLELTVADDGRGFDPALPQGRHRVGLASMRERARSLGGQLTLATSPGQGTRVTVRVPLR